MGKRGGRGERRQFRETLNGAEGLAILGGAAGAAAYYDAATGGGDDESPYEMAADGVAVLRIEGPLEHHTSWCWQSYEQILCDTEKALSDESCRILVHRIDSPGGVAAGAGEAHHEVRRLAKKYGKRILAYVDEMACSAGYELASAADEIWMPPAAQVGSIGVILCTLDESRALRKQGVAIRYVVTGARKADLHPGQPVTDEVLAVAQQKVDALGRLFFAAVASGRGMTPEAVEGLQAAVFQGQDAVDAGLADAVASWPEFLERVVRSLDGAGAGASSGTHAPSRATSDPAAKQGTSVERTMAKILTLQKALDDAKASVSTARKAHEKLVGGKDRKALSLALVALFDAMKVEESAKAALGAAQAKTTTTKHIKHEEKVTEREEADEEEADEDADEEADDESVSDSEATDTSDSTGPATDASASYGEKEEEKVVAKAWVAAQRAYERVVDGHPREQPLLLSSPTFLLRYARKATSQQSIAGVMGALGGLSESIKHNSKVEARMAKLEAANRATKVDAILAKARASGRVVVDAHRSALRAEGIKQGTKWLSGHVATLPKLVRTEVDGEFIPRAGTDGAPLGAPSADEQSIRATVTAGLNPEQAAKAMADFDARLKKANGATPKH